ncbi:MAG: hypothetical protein ABL883_11130 [Terricaulis sp.]
MTQGACWLLGVAAIGDVEIDLVAARELNDPRSVMAVAGALKCKRKNWRGLILTGAQPMVDIGGLPRGLKVVELKDIIVLDQAGKIAIDLKWAAAKLGPSGGGKGEHGASRSHPHLVPYLEKRLASGRALANDSAEARQVLADPTWATPGERAPGFDAMRVMVGRLRKKLG